MSIASELKIGAKTFYKGYKFGKMATAGIGMTTSGVSANEMDMSTEATSGMVSEATSEMVSEATVEALEAEGANIFLEALSFFFE